MQADVKAKVVLDIRCELSKCSSHLDLMERNRLLCSASCQLARTNEPFVLHVHGPEGNGKLIGFVS